MIIDSTTGGKIGGMEHGGRSGAWTPAILFPLYMVCGICYGIIELGKRVVPRMLVGRELVKLRQIDSLVSMMVFVSPELAG